MVQDDGDEPDDLISKMKNGSAFGLLCRVAEPEGSWIIDREIVALISAGMFYKKSTTLVEVRQDLILSVIAGLAIARAKTQTLKIAKSARHRAKVILAFLEVLDNLEIEIENCEHLRHKHPDLIDESEIEFLLQFKRAGDVIYPLARKYAEHDFNQNDFATKHFEREYFKAMRKWWNGNIDTGWHGREAALEKVSYQLWMTFGFPIPEIADGFSGEQQWAKNQFRLLKNTER